MIWEIELHKLLRHGAATFELQLQFDSSAARLALYGPSGAGKTQTLKMLAGIQRPDAGRVALQGQVLFDAATRVNLPPQQRRLGYVFQDYALFPHLSVRQNIAFALCTGWMNAPEDYDHPVVERWIGAFHLEGVAEHLPHQISGGQRQRTALARALVNGPRALLLDEPFAALDKALRQHLRGELRELQQQLKLPMLLITHDDDDLRELADEVVHVLAGRRIASPPAAVI